MTTTTNGLAAAVAPGPRGREEGIKTRINAMRRVHRGAGEQLDGRTGR